MRIIRVTNITELQQIKELFIEYEKSLDINLKFQNFKEELEVLSKKYGEPDGTMLLALYNNEVSGCVAIRKIDNQICELKRLYVKQEFRGKKIGIALISEAIKRARKIGYKSMKLDTLKRMKSAVKLYKRFGFKETESYLYNPIKDALYFEIEL
ncbi:GNAT family N-acetyltransferase [Clostridiaceae bacterium M8S5]|nr:GNAT family N-acetyltransferase [Clostridiaceae bacterium M8S5]